MTFTKDQIEIMKVYCKIISKNKFSHPTFAHLKKEKISIAKVKYHFENLADLRKCSKLFSPDTFKNIIDESIYSPEKLQRIIDRIDEKSKFVITTAVAGCQVHKEFYLSLKNYCKKNKAVLLILPVMDPASNAGWEMDSLLRDENVVMSDMNLNSNIWLSTIKLSAKQIDPITSLSRIGHRQGSFIYGSPKQRLRLVPTSNVGYPRAMMTTGAITRPNYSTERYMSERTGYISTIDHVMGAIIVEVENNKVYHYRQIQADKSGGFADMGNYYTPNDLSEMRPEAIVFGDYHAGETDLIAEAGTLKLVDLVKPKRGIFHDLFNGRSINPHEKQQLIMKALRSIRGELSLEDEFKAVDRVFDLWGPKFEQLIVVESNHDLFLKRYLEDGGYVKDFQNKKIALQLALAMLDGHNPFKFAMETLGNKFLNKVKWISEDEDYKIAKIELGAHGHLGANGGNASLQSMENSYGNSVTAHSHTPEILRGAYRVGTKSLLKLSYNRGASSWLHTDCLVYSNGARQLINYINGKFRLE